MDKLQAVERETIVLFNDGEKEATITTCNVKWTRRMTKLWGPGEQLRDGPYYRWNVPKNRVVPPRPKSKARIQAGKRLASRTVDTA